MVKNKSIAAHVPLLKIRAGYGNEWYVVLYIIILPLGYSFLDCSNNFRIEFTFLRSIELTLPSLFNYSPRIEAIAMGNLNNLGIIPDWIKALIKVNYLKKKFV